MDFEVRESGSAAQYALRTDPAFSVRVSKPTAPELRVTSALQGNLAEPAFGAALVEIIGRHSANGTASIRFVDIADGLATNDKHAVGERFDLLFVAVRRWAKSVGREVHNGYLDLEGSGFSAVFRLA
jgi:hypothetical protein